MLNLIQREDYILKKKKIQAWVNEDGLKCPATLAKVYLMADWFVKGFKVH